MVGGLINMGKELDEDDVIDMEKEIKKKKEEDKT